MVSYLAPLRPYDAVQPYLHTNARLRERHNLSITPAEYLQLCQDVNRDLHNLKTASAGPHKRVKVNYSVLGWVVPLVFDPGSQLIVTVLDTQEPPPEYKEPRERKPQRRRKKGNNRAQRHRWQRYDEG